VRSFHAAQPRLPSLLLTRRGRHDTRQAHTSTATSLRGIQDQVEALQTQIADLREAALSRGDETPHESNAHLLKQVLVSVEPISRRNIHFSMPQSVRSFFTGREDLLKSLSHSFLQRPGPLCEQTQRRFVIHGIAGSGKTQFCCKFADMNRYKYVPKEW
jgi:hypothetical protein